MPHRYEQQLEELLALYHRQREEALDTRRRINETTATVTAPRQTVKVTVGAQGEVTALSFPTGAYRRLAPKELADVVLATIRQARAEALESVGAVVAVGLPSGIDMADLLQGRVDATAFLPEEPPTPESTRDTLMAKLREDTHG
ncbi:YbaB/EbfC family nucleoid-associated protein [Streptomyces sp. NPDC001068]|uniref:YbaB/EbfC family nucleoid-associated protein n=1 Tax=Streptomyces sp. NPDC001068 TaxID=3364544 RepID=UPI0036BEB6EA